MMRDGVRTHQHHSSRISFWLYDGMWGGGMVGWWDGGLVVFLSLSKD